MARTNTSTGGGGGGAWASITGTPTEIPYFDVAGNGTSDADHTLLADGTLRLASTHGDVTGKFYQGDEPLVGNQHVWGKYAEDAVTGSLAADLFIEGTASPEFGNDIALIRAGQFQPAGSEYSEIIYSGGVETGMAFGTAGTFYTETILDGAYKLSYSDETTSGGVLYGSVLGMGILSQDWSSISTGYPVDTYFGQIFADDEGISTRVKTGKDHVDYVQDGTTISPVAFTGAGLDDFTPGGDYTGSLTGTYIITCIGNDGARIVFNAGMTTGTQFAEGEVVTGSISGATATVSVGISDTRIWVYDVVGIFALGDILTGDQGNVSTAVTTGGGANGDLFQVDYSDLSNTHIQWFTGNQASPVAFPGIGGATYLFGAGSGHTPTNSWAFAESANYKEKQKVDATGTVFSNNANGTNTHAQDIPITATVTLSPAQVNDMNSNPVSAGITVPTGYAIQILEVYGQNTYNTTPYATNTTINIAFTSAPTQSVWQQNNLLIDTATTIRRFVKTSGAGAEVIVPNDGLVITNTSGNPTAGDSDIDIYITYKLIEL